MAHAEYCKHGPSAVRLVNVLVLEQHAAALGVCFLSEQAYRYIVKTAG